LPAYSDTAIQPSSEKRRVSITAGLLLPQAGTASKSRFFTFTQPRRHVWYEPLSRFATTPSKPRLRAEIRANNEQLVASGASPQKGRADLVPL
jgi:hypothetical protein